MRVPVRQIVLTLAAVALAAAAACASPTAPTQHACGVTVRLDC